MGCPAPGLVDDGSEESSPGPPEARSQAQGPEQRRPIETVQATFVILHFLVATWRKVKDASDIYFIYPNIAKIVSVYHLINVKHYGDILLFFVVFFF